MSRGGSAGLLDVAKPRPSAAPAHGGAIGAGLSHLVHHSSPCIRQTGPNDSGLACLAMVARHHGIESALFLLRRLCVLSAEGATLKALIDAAVRLGFNARALKGGARHLDELALPSYSFGVGQ